MRLLEQQWLRTVANESVVIVGDYSKYSYEAGSAPQRYLGRDLFHSAAPSHFRFARWCQPMVGTYPPGPWQGLERPQGNRMTTAEPHTVIVRKPRRVQTALIAVNGLVAISSAVRRLRIIASTSGADPWSARVPQAYGRAPSGLSAFI